MRTNEIVVEVWGRQNYVANRHFAGCELAAALRYGAAERRRQPHRRVLFIGIARTGDGGRVSFAFAWPAL